MTPLLYKKNSFCTLKKKVEKTVTLIVADFARICKIRKTYDENKSFELKRNM